MSREIKFRAWDKITKRYYSVETWHMEDEYVDLIESNKSTADPNAKRFWRRISEVILEQSTGLKDVNGKEIYEGDLLKVKMQDSWQTVPELVKHIWDPHMWMAESDPYYAVREMVVIGNIYEDSQLLEADK